MRSNVVKLHLLLSLAFFSFFGGGIETAKAYLGLVEEEKEEVEVELEVEEEEGEEEEADVIVFLVVGVGGADEVFIVRETAGAGTAGRGSV